MYWHRRRPQADPSRFRTVAVSEAALIHLSTRRVAAAAVVVAVRRPCVRFMFTVLCSLKDAFVTIPTVLVCCPVIYRRRRFSQRRNHILLERRSIAWRRISAHYCLLHFFVSIPFTSLQFKQKQKEMKIMGREKRDPEHFISYSLLPFFFFVFICRSAKEMTHAACNSCMHMKCAHPSCVTWTLFLHTVYSVRA